MNRNKGLTIIQTMLILLVLGIVGSLVVNAIIDKRCADRPGTAQCESRSQSRQAK